MNTNQKGTIAEAKILARLLEIGRTVLRPYGTESYDLALDDNGKLIRIQCKLGRLENGSIVFNAYTSSRQVHMISYRGKADLFGVWCPEYDQVFLIPVESVGETKVALRVEEPKKPNSNIRWAKDYKI